MKRKIFVVDDHPVMRKGYQFLIDQEPDLVVCGEAGTALEALEKVSEEHPDLMLVDISLGGMSGLELIKKVHAQYPELATLVVSTHDESLYGERALRAGARGYVMKSEADGVIVEAIRRVLHGGYYVSERMSDKILRQFQQQGTSLVAETSVQQLSDRELEVFELMGQGMTTQEIAEALVISPKTVESHRGRIKAKLAIETTTELMRRATLWCLQTIQGSSLVARPGCS